MERRFALVLLLGLLACSKDHAPRDAAVPEPDARARADAEADASPVADPAAFCTNRDTWICARRLANGELTMEEAEACVSDAVDRCAGVSWAPGCTPTERQADACISALMDAARLPEPEPPAGFPECDLCG